MNCFRLHNISSPSYAHKFLDSQMQPTPKDYLFVTIQGVLFLAYLFIPAVTFSAGFLRIPGLILSILGAALCGWSLLALGKSLTALPTPRHSGTLKTSGPFSFARHPVYSGILAFALGYAVFQQDMGKLSMTALLWILFYFKSRYEEERLLLKYGTHYAEYCKKTGRFFTL